MIAIRSLGLLGTATTAGNRVMPAWDAEERRKSSAIPANPSSWRTIAGRNPVVRSRPRRETRRRIYHPASRFISREFRSRGRSFATPHRKERPSPRVVLPRLRHGQEDIDLGSVGEWRMSVVQNDHAVADDTANPARARRRLSVAHDDSPLRMQFPVLDPRRVIGGRSRGGRAVALRTPGSSPRTRPPGCRPRTPGCAWRCGPGTSGRG